MTWLEKTPICLVQAHVEMMGRLEAEEALTGVDVVGVGSGAGKSDTRRSRIRSWERAARGSGRPTAATPDGLKAAGIGMRVVKRG